MAKPDTLECQRCGRFYPIGKFERACDSCAGDGIASNLTVRYPDAPAPLRDALPDTPRSLWRYADFLPLAADDAVTLGEGMTPLVPVVGFGHRGLWLKDESRNPTLSFKDRLATVAVSWAKRVGAPVIATSSSGNAGASAAAYARRAGLPCVVLTYKGAAPAIVAQMISYGAMVLTVPTMDDRWKVLSRAVAELGWFPTSPFFGPAIGSNPIGIEGYKTLAYEIAEQLDWHAPDWCVLPVCYGDALYGVWKGFDEMRRWGWIDSAPRLVAAEISGSLEAGLAAGDDAPPDVPRAAKSIAGSIEVTRSTFQALHALRQSDGLAVRLDDATLLAARDRLAATSGIFAEISSAAGPAAVDRLARSGDIRPGQSVVAVMTASGLKDFGLGDVPERAAPEVAPDLDSVRRALKDSYGFDG